jgi:hypothetical protein
MLKGRTLRVREEALGVGGGRFCGWFKLIERLGPGRSQHKHVQKAVPHEYTSAGAGIYMTQHHTGVDNGVNGLSKSEGRKKKSRVQVVEWRKEFDKQVQVRVHGH